MEKDLITADSAIRHAYNGGFASPFSFDDP
jgi:hypothetical protein